MHANPLGVWGWVGVGRMDGMDGMGGVCQQIPTDLDSHHTHSVGGEGGVGGIDSDLAHADTHTPT